MSETRSYPVLPKLTRDILTTPGQWQKSGPEVVKDVADGLEVPDRIYDLKSIPDVWARPLLFESALFAKSQPSRTKIVQGEWRGLLALLALRRMRGLGNLVFEPVFKDDQGSFIKVAKRLLPDVLVNPAATVQWQNSSIHSGTTWQQVSIILLDDKAIGLTSPTTLVATAAEYTEKLDFRRIPWFQDGYLQDPNEFLSDEEKSSLADWLHTVHQDLIKMGANGSKWLLLSQSLETYIKSLSSGKRSVLNILTDVAVQGPIFSYLGSPIPLSEEPKESDVELMPDPARFAFQNRRALVLDEDTARQWRKKPTEITVRQSLPLAAALAGRDEKRRDLVAGVPLPNADWYEAKDFFTDSVTVFPNPSKAKAFPGTRSVAGQSDLRMGGQPVAIILPIRSKWLAWFTADSLARRVTLVSDGDSIKVSLRLSLRGGELTLNRSYSRAEIRECAITKVPVCKVWPFIGSPSWKLFYTYYDNGGSSDMVTLIPHTDRPADFFRRIIPNVPADHVAVVWRTPSIPEAMVASFGDKEAGILLLESPKPAPSPGGSWNVGIDFGTTGTTIFYRRPSEEKGKPLILQPRLLDVTAEATDLAKNSYIRFLPSQPQFFGSVLSIYHDFESSKPEVPEVVQPLTEGHIAYLQYSGSFSAWGAGIHTDMKWGGVHERALGQAFLHQLGLQICAEAADAGVGTISWRFSFPTAFSTSRLQDFTGIWGYVVQKSNETSGIKGNPNPGDEASLFRYKNESVATAHCFRVTEEAFLEGGAVCIDIGGGTTDIAVWQNNRIVSQTSFRFAGRDLFLHPLHERPSLLEAFGCNISDLLEAKADRELAFHSQVDVLLKTRSGDYPDMATRMMQQLNVLKGNAIVAGFVNLLTLGVAGIFHYIGLMLRDLEARGQYKRFLPNIYIGGNGSKILHWCAGGVFRPRLDADQKFQRVFARATGFKDLNKQTFEIVLSRAPKSEVAHGLVIDKIKIAKEEPLDLFAETTNDPPLLVGEDCTVGGEKKEWSFSIDKTFELSSLRINETLPQCSAFLKNLGVEAEAGILRRCAQAINQDLSEIDQEKRADDNGEALIEPVFIVVLKKLYEQKIEKWANLPAEKKHSVAG